MKRIQYRQYGGPEVMQLDHFELGVPDRDEVAVRVKVAAINPIDWKIRRGQMKILTGRAFPRAMGVDVAGTVMAVGSDVTRLKVGDEVFGQSRFKESGGLGEAVITKADFLAIKPSNLSFDDAACLGTAGVTAWIALGEKARLMAGQQVFINGCGGAVGEAAVQVARWLGARVSGSCGANDMQRARDFGIDEVFDYRTTSLSRIPGRFDAVLDAAATMDVAKGVGLLRKGGVFLDLNPDAGKFLRSLWDRRLKLVMAKPRADVLDRVARAAEDGLLRVTVGKAVPLDQAVEFIASIESGQRIGGKGLVLME